MSKAIETWLHERNTPNVQRVLWIEPATVQVDGKPHRGYLAGAVLIPLSSGGVPIGYKRGKPRLSIEEAQASLAEELVSEAGKVLSTSDD